MNVELPESGRSSWIRWGLSILAVVVPILLFARLMGNQVAVANADSKLRPIMDIVLHFRSFQGRLPADKEELVRVERPELNLTGLPARWGYRLASPDQFVVYLYGPDEDDDRGQKKLNPWDVLLRDGDLALTCDDAGRILRKNWD